MNLDAATYPDSAKMAPGPCKLLILGWMRLVQRWPIQGVLMRSGELGKERGRSDYLLRQGIGVEKDEGPRMLAQR